nr:restriction endonuclease subunit S [Mycoplasmopsis bovis]
MSFFNQCFRFWEQKKLRNVVSYHSSMMIASDVKKYGKFDVYDPNKIVGKTDAEPFRSDYISIVKDGDAGRIRLLPKNTMILSTMGALIAKDPFKIDFLYYMLNAINDLSRERNGSIIPHIYFKDYGQNIYNLPSIPEQSKISSLFTYLDSLITLHQRKLSSLKNLKNRLLDRMFCDEKSQFPSIRFTEFTNAWEQGKLGNLIDKGGSGGTPNTSNAKFYNGSIPFLTIADLTKADGHIYSTEKHITNEGLNSSSAWIVPKGSLTLSIYATIGKIGIMHQNMATSQAFYSMVINDDITKKYLYYHLKKSDVFGEWTKLISTGTQANLNSEKVKSFGIFIPKNKSEQSKISSLFTHLDSLITLHQRKLLSLKNLKSRLLDRMFCDEKSQFPSIRFKEFTNVWEQDTAKNLFIPYRVKNSNNMNLVSYSVTNKDGFVNQNEYFDDGGKAVFADKKNSLIVSRNTFAYNPSRINVGSLALYKHSEMGLVSPIYEVFQINSNNNPDFFLLWFRSEAFKNIVSTNSNKSVRDTLNLSQFESESVNFPNFAEQLKISSLFTYLDSLITLHQRKRITRTV